MSARAETTLLGSMTAGREYAGAIRAAALFLWFRSGEDQKRYPTPIFTRQTDEETLIWLSSSKLSPVNSSMM